jgi:hypothetical protein
MTFYDSTESSIILDEPTGDDNITRDPKKFLDNLADHPKVIDGFPIIVDRELAQYLIERYSLDTFMTGPVALLDGKTLSAVTREFYHLQDIVEFFTKNQNRIVLYKVYFYPKRWSFYKLNEETFEWEKHDVPVYIDREYWKLRYAVVENAEESEKI